MAWPRGRGAWAVGASLSALAALAAIPAAPQTRPPTPSAEDETLGPLDPDQPMAPLPDLEVPWPEPDQDPAPPPTLTDEALAETDSGLADKPVPLPPEDPQLALEQAPPEATELADLPESVTLDDPISGPTVEELAENEAEDVSGDGRERKYRVEITGLDGIDAGEDIIDRFENLSVLRREDDDSALAAQIGRRAEDDRELLKRVARIDGYYDADARFELVRAGDATDQLTVRFTVAPGQRYTYADIDLPGLADAGTDTQRLREAFPIAVPDPIDQDDLLAGRAVLTAEMLDSGYPFAKTGDPTVTVDHALRTGSLDMAVAPGGKRDFGRIVTQDDEPFDAEHVDLIARFDPGDLYRSSRIEDLRRAIISTGLVSQVSVTPIDAGDGRTVDIAVDMTAAPARTIAGEIGYGTGEGIRAEASWEHRNFFKPEGLVRARAVVGTREQLIDLTFRRNNFRRRDQVLTLQALAGHQDFDAYDANTALISGIFERKTTLIFQKQWSWSAGAEIVYSDERQAFNARTDIGPRPPRDTYYIAALPLSLAYDGTSDLLDPQSGFRLGGRVSPEISLESGTSGYARVQFDASTYRPINDRLVVAGRARLGTIAGAGTLDIAPSRRNYAGGGGSVRGYGYQAIGPRDINDNPVGGRGLFEVALEGRYRTKYFGGNLGLVPFIDAGNVYDSEFPDFSGIKLGAGVGIRYYTNFGPIRVDIATPLTPRAGDPPVAVYVSLGQAF